MEFGSEIWYNNKPQIGAEKLHLTYMKHVLKVKTTTSTPSVYSELGRFPLELRMKTRMINYWIRLLSLDDSHILKQAYYSLLELDNWGQENWCTHVRDNLHNANLGNRWNTQTPGPKLSCEFKEQLYSRHMQTIITAIQDSEKNPKLRTYKLLKPEYRMEQYLEIMKNEQHRITLTRLRLSAHNLAIETGRYTRPKTPVEERLCLYCNSESVENEQHFLLECTNYSEERSSLLDAVNTQIADFDNASIEDKFVKIMTSSNNRVVQALGKFTYNSLKKRNACTQNMSSEAPI